MAEKSPTSADNPLVGHIAPGTTLLDGIIGALLSIVEGTTGARVHRRMMVRQRGIVREMPASIC